ncbi:hypothetical protein GIB67_012967, partial [Kingdonia uniflora]
CNISFKENCISHHLTLKYEFGKGSDGSILLIDEVHTPDSSRYWIAHSYEERIQSGIEPENVDKEFLRLWFKDHCNPYNDEVLPDAPEELVCELAWSCWIFLFKMITKSRFEIPGMEKLASKPAVLNNCADVPKALGKAYAHFIYTAESFLKF